MRRCGGSLVPSGGQTPSGKSLPLHDERWDAAGKYGSVGWHTFRHTYRSWLDSTRAPTWSAAEAHAARAGIDHDECLRECFDGRQTKGKQQSRQNGITERIAHENPANTPAPLFGISAGAVIWVYLGLVCSLNGCGGWI